MPTYTGTLSNTGLTLDLTGLRVALVPDQPAAGDSELKGRLINTAPIYATPDSNGAFQFTSVPGEQLIGANTTTVSHIVRVEWNTPSGGRDGYDLYRVMLRAVGGPLSGMVATELAQPAKVIAQEIMPNPWPVGWVWLNTFDGELYRRVG